MQGRRALCRRDTLQSQSDKLLKGAVAFECAATRGDRLARPGGPPGMHVDPGTHAARVASGGGTAHPNAGAPLPSASDGRCRAAGSGTLPSSIRSRPRLWIHHISRFEHEPRIERPKGRPRRQSERQENNFKLSSSPGALLAPWASLWRFISRSPRADGSTRTGNGRAHERCDESRDVHDHVTSTTHATWASWSSRGRGRHAGQ
jgi:hypothetical protein